MLDLRAVRRNWPRPAPAAAAAGRASAAGRPGSGLLYEQVVQYVEELVTERGLVPGDLLPTYAGLAESGGVA